MRRGGPMQRSQVLRSASVFFLVVSLFTCLPVLAQTVTGDITGDVTDSSGAVLPHVTVTAVNAGTNFSRSATTSGTGNYRIPDLPIGQYKVTATAQGFKAVAQNAEVRAGAIVPANFKLSIGQRTEVVGSKARHPSSRVRPTRTITLIVLRLKIFA